MKQKNQEKGITLIALVITIIVLLILAGVTLASLTGENGIIKQARSATTKTIHANVLEQLQLEANVYVINKSTGETSLSLIEYLQSKQIIGSEIGEGSGKYQINPTKLLGTSPQYGKGTATESEKKDVYMLEKEDIATGDLTNITTKVASTTPVKIASISEVTYKVMYYGNTTSQNLSLGILSDSEETVNADLEYLRGLFDGMDHDDVFDFIVNQDLDEYRGEDEDGNDYMIYNNKRYKIIYTSDEKFENIEEYNVPLKDVTEAKWNDKFLGTGGSTSIYVSRYNISGIENGFELEEMEYTSNNESIAIINTNGVITGVDGGDTTITVKGKLSGKTIEINVIVDNPI